MADLRRRSKHASDLQGLLQGLEAGERHWALPLTGDRGEIVVTSSRCH